MHELGIVTHVMKTLKPVAQENRVTKIGSVTLQVGEVSGVVNDLFVDCWNYFREKDPLFSGAELIIETLPAVTFCENCKQEYPTVQYGRTCPYCGSGETYLVTGNECLIKEITAETADDEAAETEEAEEADEAEEVEEAEEAKEEPET